MLASDIALKIVQTAIKSLLSPEQANIVEGWQQNPFDNQEQINLAIARAKELLNWSDNSKIEALRVIFDRIKLVETEEKEHYWQLRAIANEKPSIPYPQVSEQDMSQYLADFRQEIAQILSVRDNWHNLSLLTLIIEKYGSFISLGEKDIAFVDLVRSTAAIAAALAENPETEKLRLIVGDLSGVQKFIYTISSAGALKSLRARSFYLELVTEEILQQLLEKLKLPRTNIIFAGASKLYILAADSDKTEEVVEEISKKFNEWLKDEFQGKVFLALDSLDFDLDKISTQKFAEVWSKANKNLDKMRSQKFRYQLSDLFTPQSAYEPCKVCHRDDVENLRKLRKDIDIDACDTCCDMYWLGDRLFDANAIVRSRNRQITNNIEFKLGNETIYYNLFQDFRQATEVSEKLGSIKQILLINNWNLKDYCHKNTVPLLLGSYGKTVTEEVAENNEKINKMRFITAEELAEASQGIKRVGYLRMDVDNLGRIFAEGLGEKQTLPQIAGLSRQMTYFFKVYLNSLAEDRDNNLPQDENYTKIEISDNKKRDNLLFIYAGGDDLFISGAWNEVVEFGFDVYQSFRAYTGYNPDITISAGISLAVPKYPLYQAADDSGKAEDASKDNERDSLTLFGETFKWDEWLGSKNLSIDTVEAKDKKYWDIVTPKPKQPKLLGVFPIVNKLNSLEISKDYSHNFVRNLVNVSNLQRQKLKEIAEERKTRDYEYEDKDIKYYLHLPQIAYTLDRLPKKVLDDEDFRKALKNPYNAPYYRAIATWIELLNR